MLDISKAPEGLIKWHKFVAENNVQMLEEALADTVVFHSPFIWRPIQGKAETMRYLKSAVRVFKDFTYQRQFVSDDSVTLEFSARVGELQVKGVDLLQFDQEGRIIDFEVMVRPANGLQALGAAMVEQLKQV